MERREFVRNSGILATTMGSVSAYLLSNPAQAIDATISIKADEPRISKESGELNSLNLSLDNFMVTYQNLEISDATGMRVSLSAGVKGSSVADDFVQLDSDELSIDSKSGSIDVLNNTDISESYGLLDKFDRFNPSVQDGKQVRFSVTVYGGVEIAGIPNYQPIESKTSVEDDAGFVLRNPK